MQRKHPRHAPDPDRQDCHKTRLAEGSIGAVDRCECGMIQIHAGALTLRMSPEAFSDFSQTLRQADERLRADECQDVRIAAFAN